MDSLYPPPKVPEGECAYCTALATHEVRSRPNPIPERCSAAQRAAKAFVGGKWRAYSRADPFPGVPGRSSRTMQHEMLNAVHRHACPPSHVASSLALEDLLAAESKAIEVCGDCWPLVCSRLTDLGVRRRDGIIEAFTFLCTCQAFGDRGRLVHERASAHLPDCGWVTVAGATGDGAYDAFVEARLVWALAHLIVEASTCSSGWAWGPPSEPSAADYRLPDGDFAQRFRRLSEAAADGVHPDCAAKSLSTRFTTDFRWKVEEERIGVDLSGGVRASYSVLGDV